MRIFQFNFKIELKFKTFIKTLIFGIKTFSFYKKINKTIWNEYNKYYCIWNLLKSSYYSNSYLLVLDFTHVLY